MSSNYGQLQFNQVESICKIDKNYFKRREMQQFLQDNFYKK